MIDIASVLYSIDDEFPNSINRELIGVVTDKSIYFACKSDVAEYKFLGVFNLFVYGAAVVCLIYELHAVCTFEYGAPEFRERKWGVM